MFDEFSGGRSVEGRAGSEAMCGRKVGVFRAGYVFPIVSNLDEDKRRRCFPSPDGTPSTVDAGRHNTGSLVPATLVLSFIFSDVPTTLREFSAFLVE